MKKVINSDAFQTVLDKRREQIVNPIISQTVQERLRGVTNSAIDLLQTRLDAGHVKNEEAIEIAKMGLETQGLLGNAKAVAESISAEITVWCFQSSLSRRSSGNVNGFSPSGSNLLLKVMLISSSLSI